LSCGNHTFLDECKRQLKWKLEGHCSIIVLTEKCQNFFVISNTVDHILGEQENPDTHKIKLNAKLKGN
jgi:hypothetical protein